MTIDNTFWALVALVIFFIIIAGFKVPATIARTLDARSARIRREIEEARELKDEARRQLGEFQRRRQEAEAEARAIVAHAESEAAAIVDEARVRSEDYVARRSAIAESKIAQAEQDAIAEVRSTAVDLAIAAAGRIIAERSGEGAAFTDRSIDEVRRRLN